MDQRAQPDQYSVWSAEFLLAHEQVNTPVIVVHAIQQSSQRVFLHPVNLEVAEGLAVPASDDGEAVSARQILQEKLLLYRTLAAHLPHRFDSRVIHPAVQRVEVRWHVLEEVLLDAGHR